ncbi:MAG TPA: hypothetical protein VH325_06455 [Bryobacteraceae bacterium]|nr:hypothetical protein [Bryobacteraceae bacterium]
MMSSRQNRTARRAAERAAQKSHPNNQERESTCEANEPVPSRETFPSRARQEEVLQPSTFDLAMPQPAQHISPIDFPPSAPASPSISPARLAANRANAQLSTGPTSESGKAKSSQNALKTALTGRTVLLPHDDADRYERHLNSYRKAYSPVGERECELVQSLADTTWRIDRIPGIEEALYIKGFAEFASKVAELDPRSRASMLRMETYLAYERQFRNLHTQEMRLHRLREKLIAEIKQLQTEREQKEKDDLAIAAKLYIAAKHDHKSFDPADFGFEFSTADVEAYLQGQRASMLTEKAMSTRGR